MNLKEAVDPGPVPHRHLTWHRLISTLYEALGPRRVCFGWASVDLLELAAGSVCCSKAAAGRFKFLLAGRLKHRRKIVLAFCSPFFDHFGAELSTDFSDSEQTEERSLFQFLINREKSMNDAAGTCGHVAYAYPKCQSPSRGTLMLA